MECEVISAYIAYLLESKMYRKEPSDTMLVEYFLMSITILCGSTIDGFQSWFFIADRCHSNHQWFLMLNSCEPGKKLPWILYLNIFCNFVPPVVRNWLITIYAIPHSAGISRVIHSWGMLELSMWSIENIVIFVWWDLEIVKNDGLNLQISFSPERVTKMSVLLPFNGNHPI